MQTSNILFLCATLIATTIAQSPTTTSLHFTTIPTALVAGVEATIGWAGGNGNSVNVVLQQGRAEDLHTVPIPPIASGAQGNSTTFTPPKSLPNAGNYALRIEQGQDTINYSGMLQLFGGCSTCPTDAAAAFASASKTSAGPATASSSSSAASSTSKSGVVGPVVSSGPISNSNSTGATGSSSNSTTTGSGTNSTLSTGGRTNTTTSGTNSTTNSTLSSATLRATSSASSSSSSSTSSSTSSSSSGSTSSSTGSSTSPSPTSGGVTVAASNFALILCAIVGIIYLG